MDAATAIAPVERDARFKLNAVPEAASIARALVEATLVDWRIHRLIADAQLIASELVTNSAAATPGDIVWLLLAQSRDAVWVCVWDSSPVLPDKHPCTLDSESGRGLRIVAAIADEDGVFPTAEPKGKIVWALLKI